MTITDEDAREQDISEEDIKQNHINRLGQVPVELFTSLSISWALGRSKGLSGSQSARKVNFPEQCFFYWFSRNLVFFVVKIGIVEFEAFPSF